MTEPSYVLGNSWQINLLTDAERAHLDRAQWVFVCNEFPEFWKQAGFRPTVWAFGDTQDRPACEMLERQFNAIRGDANLQQRLRRLFVCQESERAERLVAKAGLPITIYRRGHWGNPHQKFATSLYQPLYHRSTGVDLVNLAMLLNPGQDILLYGLQRGMRRGHYYDGGPFLDTDPQQFVEQPMWQAFGEAVAQGVAIVDCNREHSPAAPNVYGIPTGILIDGVTE